MRKAVLKLLVMLFSLMVVACGGGGGGDVAAPAPEDFTLSKSSVASYAAVGSQTVYSTQINYTGNNPNIYSVSASVITSSATWLSGQIYPAQNYGLILCDPAGLASGVYTATVRITAKNVNNVEISHKDIPVTFTIYSNATPVPTTVSSVAWNSYNADALPDAADALTLSSGGTASFTRRENSGSMAAAVSNGELSFDTSAVGVPTNTGAELTDFRYSLPYLTQYPKKMTYIARVKAASATSVLRGLAIEANFTDSASAAKTEGSRVKLSIYGISPTSTWQGFTLESCDNSGSTPVVCRSLLTNFSDILSYHVYHVSVTLTDAKHGYVYVYIDGNATPVVTYGSAATPLTLSDAVGTGANYIRFGDMDNGFMHKSAIDWLIWTQGGAYSPAEIKGKLPANIGTIPATYQ